MPAEAHLSIHTFQAHLAMACISLTAPALPRGSLPNPVQPSPPSNASQHAQPHLAMACISRTAPSSSPSCASISAALEEANTAPSRRGVVERP